MNNPSRSGRRRWDGSRYGTPTQRLLRLAPDTQVRVLRRPQSRPCQLCGNRVEWFPRPEAPPVALHPHELLAKDVLARLRWHVARGFAFPVHDGTDWCRVPHPALCPGRDGGPPAGRLGRLAPLRRELALRTRKLIDQGQFTPSVPDSPGSVLAQPRKDIVYLLHLLYLAPGPLDAIRCVAQTRRRTRCPATLLDPPDTAPWFSLSVPPAPRDDHLTGSLTGTVMLARDLTHLAYHEQLRWRYQRCRQHAAGLAADVILPQWLPFDAFAHHQHIVTIRPAAPETGTSA